MAAARAARTRRIDRCRILKVRIRVDLAEQLGGYAIVAAFAEVAAVGEVSTAQVDADVKILGAAGETIVVQLHVAVEKSISVLSGGFEAIEHLFGAEILAHQSAHAARTICILQLWGRDWGPAKRGSSYFRRGKRRMRDGRGEERVCGPAFSHRMVHRAVGHGSLTRKVWVVDRDIAHTGFVEDLEFVSIGSGDIGKILGIIGVDPP